MRGAWRDRVGQWVSLSLLAVLTTGSWLIATILSTGEFTSTARDSQDLTSVVKAATIYRTGPDGDREQEIKSLRLEQFRDGRSTLAAPVLIQTKPNQAMVQVGARQADISSDQKVVKLKGNVVLERSAFNEGAAVRVQTENLEYLVDDEIAKTSDPVRVQRGNSELHGVGMFANQKTGRLDVLADSRMVIPQEPKKASKVQSSKNPLSP